MEPLIGDQGFVTQVLVSLPLLRMLRLKTVCQYLRLYYGDYLSNHGIIILIVVLLSTYSFHFWACVFYMISVKVRSVACRTISIKTRI